MGDKKEVGEGEAGEYVRTTGQAENKAEREKRAAGKKGREGRRQKEPDAG